MSQVACRAHANPLATCNTYYALPIYIAIVCTLYVKCITLLYVHCMSCYCMYTVCQIVCQMYYAIVRTLYNIIMLLYVHCMSNVLCYCMYTVCHAIVCTLYVKCIMLLYVHCMSCYCMYTVCQIVCQMYYAIVCTLYNIIMLLYVHCMSNVLCYCMYTVCQMYYVIVCTLYVRQFAFNLFLNNLPYQAIWVLSSVSCTPLCS